jgi:hypothetical protein
VIRNLNFILKKVKSSRKAVPFKMTYVSRFDLEVLKEIDEFLIYLKQVKDLLRLSLSRALYSGSVWTRESKLEPLHNYPC